jgi:L-histidine Nalpha-methyltransferase
MKPVKLLEDAYNDSRGITAAFILNVFHNINRLLKSNFELTKMRYQSWFNHDWQQIEMYAVANERQHIVFPDLDSAFDWQKDEKILVEISRKFEPQRLQQQLRFFGLTPVLHLTDPNQWFSVLLFKKQS